MWQLRQNLIWSTETYEHVVDHRHSTRCRNFWTPCVIVSFCRTLLPVTCYMFGRSRVGFLTRRRSYWQSFRGRKEFSGTVLHIIRYTLPCILRVIVTHSTLLKVSSWRERLQSRYNATYMLQGFCLCETLQISELRGSAFQYISVSARVFIWELRRLSDTNLTG